MSSNQTNVTRRTCILFFSVLYTIHIRLTLMTLFIGLQRLIYPLRQINHKSFRSLICISGWNYYKGTNVICCRVPFKLWCVSMFCSFFLENLTRQLIWKTLMMIFFSTKGAYVKPWGRTHFISCRCW